ncbi:MAG: hemerythrin domain-containing protein [Chryseobacterium sp.]|jgi:hemerythrin-like domain-containing protein|uniref:hemerythrin domain-containing protein n=1 Tax=Chryseobacterium sp. TaxID=1871047 RepID=UPI002825D3C7|nr:hemerythrin domain-containing protein [Chryseobacterium sp.]MDR2235009.1 hemerythrin domain-containing protein [Chryseobacterium sp.]
MKRNENIILLSRDHHFGLLCSWKIRQGLKKGIKVSRITKYVLHFWDSHLKEHFREEEQILIPYLEDEFSQRIQSEHQQLEAAISGMKGSETADLLSYFADLLEQHIRFEERTWFPHLEAQLNPADLEKIGKELDRIHHSEQDTYEDEFWK